MYPSRWKDTEVYVGNVLRGGLIQSVRSKSSPIVDENISKAASASAALLRLQTCGVIMLMAAIRFTGATSLKDACATGLLDVQKALLVVLSLKT